MSIIINLILRTPRVRLSDRRELKRGGMKGMPPKNPKRFFSYMTKKIKKIKKLFNYLNGSFKNPKLFIVQNWYNFLFMLIQATR